MPRETILCEYDREDHPNKSGRGVSDPSHNDIATIGERVEVKPPSCMVGGTEIDTGDEPGEKEGQGGRDECGESVRTAGWVRTATGALLGWENGTHSHSPGHHGRPCMLRSYGATPWTGDEPGEQGKGGGDECGESKVAGWVKPAASGGWPGCKNGAYPHSEECHSRPCLRSYGATPWTGDESGEKEGQGGGDKYGESVVRVAGWVRMTTLLAVGAIGFAVEFCWAASEAVAVPFMKGVCTRVHVLLNLLYFISVPFLEILGILFK